MIAFLNKKYLQQTGTSSILSQIQSHEAIGSSSEELEGRTEESMNSASATPWLHWGVTRVRVYDF